MNITFLRECIVALRNSPDPKGFTMRMYKNSCGTPACVLGHLYYARGEANLSWLITRAREEEGFSYAEASELFHSSDGCGGAKTSVEAIAYLEKVIARYQPRRTDAELVADLKQKIMQPIPEDAVA
jgi:hypothetical protein